MVIDKKFKGLVKEDFRYVFNGSIETTENLEIDLDMTLFVTGSIKAGSYIKAGLYIKAGRSIEAGGYIEAGGSIEAGEYIEAGSYIKAGLYIKAGRSIEAGGSIKAGRSIEAGGSIKAGEYIEAGWSIKAGSYIEAGGSIEAGEHIKAGRYIEAGLSIEAGGSYGIIAGLSITCKTNLTFGLKIFAGVCSWRGISDEEKTITCGKFNGGVVEYGILKEVGLPEERDVIQEMTLKEVCEKLGYEVKIKKD